MARIYQEFLCEKKPWGMNYEPSSILFLPQNVKFMPYKKEQKSGHIYIKATDPCQIFQVVKSQRKVQQVDATLSPYNRILR